MPKKGFLTPSTFADLMTNGRGTNGFGKQAQNVIDQYTLDLLDVMTTAEYDGEEYIEPTSPACRWGLRHEWEAIETYKEFYLCDVERPGFMISRTHPYIGGTCDGLVGLYGGIEVKCPYNSSEHMANLLHGKQISQYIYQIQGYMFIYNRKWWDFVSYDPRYDYKTRLYVQRIERDDAMIAAIVARCEEAHRIALTKVEAFRAATLAA